MENAHKRNEMDDVEQKIKENNRQISRLLAENENLLRERGYNPPVHNYALNDIDRIKFPSNYIRTKDIFIEKYKLEFFFENPVIRSNVAYSLQMSDMYNYIINRFRTFGSINTMLYNILLSIYII